MSGHWEESPAYLRKLMMDPDRLRLTPVVIKETKELETVIETNARFLTVVTFVAPWSQGCKSLMETTREFVVDPDMEHVLFAEITAEDFPDVCDKFAINSVPAVLFFRHQHVVERLTGGEVANFAKQVLIHANDGPNIHGVPKSNMKTQTPQRDSQDNLVSTSALSLDSNPTPLYDRIKALINQADVMIFMKGDPERPRCGFSRQICQLIHDSGVAYEFFDILEDEEIRQGLKSYSNWQTYPQVYVKGKLIGGLDVVRELQEVGQLEDVLRGKQEV